MFTKERNRLVFGNRTVGHAECEINQSVISRNEFMVIEQDEGFSRRDHNSFVAVDERVVLAQVKQIGRHGGKSGVQELATKLCLWHRSGGLQQTTITEFWATTVFLDPASVNFQHLLNR